MWCVWRWMLVFKQTWARKEKLNRCILYCFFVTCDLPISLNIHLITFFLSIYLPPSLTPHILGRKKKQKKVTFWAFMAERSLRPLSMILITIPNIRYAQKHSNDNSPPEKRLNAVDDFREVKGEGHIRIFITPIGSVDRRFLRGQGLCQAWLASIGTHKIYQQLYY